jgi:hypothetical protein
MKIKKRIEFKAVFYAFTLFMALISVTSFAQSSKGKRIRLNKGGDQGVMIMAANFPVSPGDTLVLSAQSNPYSYIYLSGLKGTKQRPIVVINEGGQVQLSAGFDVQSCQHLKISGSGSKDKFGFAIRKSGGTAFTIHDFTAHVEIERFYVNEAAFGCWIKNEASCDTAINNWVLDDIAVHDYEMRNIGIEGFYMGSTDPNAINRPVTCNGEVKRYRPSRLGNIKIYNGLIDGTGRPGIQLSNASVGMSEIYNNTVMNCGREYNDQQGSGIALGGYTRAYVHHNRVKNTMTWGIVSLGGSGLIRIENNRVDSSGYLDGRALPWPQNICIDTRLTQPVDSTKFIIRNNIVSVPGSGTNHIEVWQTVKSYAAGSIICNNTSNGKPARVKTDPAVKWQDCKGVVVKAGSSNKSFLVYGFVGGAGLLLLTLYFFALKKQKVQLA